MMIKVISIFSIFLLLSLGNKQETPISRIADFDMPENLVYIEHEQGELFVKKNYIYLTNVKSNNHMFSDGTTIVGIKDYDKRKVDFLNLDEKKRQRLEVIKQTKMEKFITKTEIIKIRNTSFLIMGQYYQDEYAYNIISELKGNKGISIQLQFKRDEKERTEKLITQLLNGIRFHPPTMVNN